MSIGKNSESGKDENQEMKEGIALVSEETYDTLVQNFIKLKQELLSEKGTANYCREFEKLFYVLAKTKENEQRMIDRCSDLTKELTENHEKMEKTIEMCLNNKRTIEDLQKELDFARILVRNAQENETEASHLTKNVRQQFTKLSELLNEGGSSILENKKKEELGKQLQMKSLELEQMTLRMEGLKQQVSEFEAMQEDENNRVKQLETALASEELEKQRELRKKEKLERDLRQAKDMIDELTTEGSNSKVTIEGLRTDITRLQQQLKEQKAHYDKFVKENVLQQEAYRKLQNEASFQETNYTRLANDLLFKSNELKLKEEEIGVLRQEVTKMKYNLTKASQKLKNCEEQKNVITKQFEIQKGEAVQLEKEFNDCKGEMENMRKELNELFMVKEANKAQNNMMTAESRVKHKNTAAVDTSFLKMKMEAMKTETKFYVLENAKLRNNVRNLHRVNVEKLKCQERVEFLTKRVKEQALSFNLTFVDMERKSHDMKVQLKELNSKMEAIRVERNSIAKNALELKSEVYNMKQQATLISHQVDQLREQTSYKDAALLKERHENQQLTKNVENYKEQSMKLRDHCKELENLLKLKERENGKLRSEIKKAWDEKNATKRAKKKIMSENNIVTSQLIRRNDEMTLLYEKIKLFDDNLNRGLIVYNRRLEDIRILKMEVRKLRCTNLYMMKGLETMEDKRREIFRIQQENLQVRTRCKVLEDELENPLNIHRWRKLKGSDPSQYEMILKMQWLQRRLIAKTEMVIQKEKVITEKDLLFAEIKKTMARQSGPETLEELSYTRTCLNKANYRIKALQAEVKMYKDMYDRSREKALKESNALKEKYLKLKRQKDGLGLCVTPFVAKSRESVVENNV